MDEKTFIMNTEEGLREENNMLEQELVNAMLKFRTLSILLKKYGMEMQESSDDNKGFETGEFIESLGLVLEDNAKCIKSLIDNRANQI